MTRRRVGKRTSMAIYRDIQRALSRMAAREAYESCGPRCGCAKNEPEADHARWPCPCGAHCAECNAPARRVGGVR